MAQNDTPDLAELMVQGKASPTLQSINLLPSPNQNVQMSDAPNYSPAPNDPGVGQTAQPPGLNYNNSQQASAVQGALLGEPTPQGGSANPGIYGLLPQHLQHGTLRNILGALGDAFLVGGGGQAQYGPRMERQQIGEAMAGYNPDDPQSVQAAIQRVAATGSPGSVEVADQLQKNANDIALRKQVMEQNNWYRQSQIDSRGDQALQRMTPYIGGIAATAKDKPSYTSAYNRAESIAQRIGPNYHATDFGLVDPDEWTPGATATAGMTANNVQVSADKGQQRQTSMRNTDVNAASRIQAAGIGAGGHVQAAGISAGRTTDATILQGLVAKQNSGQPLTSAEQAAFNHMTQVSRGGGGRALPAGLVAHPAGGRAPPTAADIAYLKSHPQVKAQFDTHFGQGASAHYMGQ